MNTRIKKAEHGVVFTSQLFSGHKLQDTLICIKSHPKLHVLVKIVKIFF